MLGTWSANRLGMAGVVLAEATQTTLMFYPPGLKPFFAIREDSEDLSPEELRLVEKWLPEYLSRHYEPDEIREGRWGENVLTTFLFKRPGGWFWFRGSGRVLWMTDEKTPDTGAPLERILEILIAD